MQLQLQDAISIAGKEDGFTAYLNGKTANPIGAALQPKIKNYLTKSGTYGLLNQFFNYYKKFAGFFGRRIPAGPDLETYVAQKAVEGLFYKLAAKEGEFRAEKLPAIFN